MTALGDTRLRVEVTGDRLLVTDPCYVPDTPHGYVWVDRVRPGTWVASYEMVESFGSRVSVLSLRHPSPAPGPASQEYAGEAGVDAGMVMVADGARAGEFRETDSDDLDLEYDRPGPYPFTYQGACSVTLRTREGADPVDVLGDGVAVVSSSGYGDGCYPVEVERDREGLAFAVHVTFIPDEDEDEDWDGDWDEEPEP